MTESQITAVKLKIEDLLKVLDVLHKETVGLEGWERQVTKQRDIVLRKEGDIAKRETILNKDKSALEVKVGRLMAKSKEIAEAEGQLEERKKRFEAQLDGLANKQLEVDTKTLELKDLEDQKQSLDERSKELDKEKKTLVEREALIEKEKKLAYERKQHLDLKEKNLNTRAQKLQRMLDAANV